MTKTFSDLLKRWPKPKGLKLVADDLGLSPNTVASWKRRNFIPLDYWAALIVSAQAHGAEGVTVAALLAASNTKRQAVRRVARHSSCDGPAA